jgi:uncharacterized protein (TIGR03437 family)
MLVESVAPGLFSANANGKGAAAAMALHAKSDGTQSSEPVFQCAAGSAGCTTAPIALGGSGGQVYLLLFGSGMRNASQKATATVGGVPVPVSGPVAQGQYAGLDQVNMGPLPTSLAGKGEIEVALTVDGRVANRVTVNIK